MMRMTNDINKWLGKNKFEERVNCRTCHRGKEKPPKLGKK